MNKVVEKRSREIETCLLRNAGKEVSLDSKNLGMGSEKYEHFYQKG